MIFLSYVKMHFLYIKSHILYKWLNLLHNYVHSRTSPKIHPLLTTLPTIPPGQPLHQASHLTLPATPPGTHPASHPTLLACIPRQPCPPLEWTFSVTMVLLVLLLLPPAKVQINVQPPIIFYTHPPKIYIPHLKFYILPPKIYVLSTPSNNLINLTCDAVDTLSALPLPPGLMNCVPVELNSPSLWRAGGVHRIFGGM